MSIPQPTTLSIHTETLLNGLSFNMVRVDGGNFLLEDKIETHISTFYMGQYPVTQVLWEAVMGKSRSRFKGGTLPIESVNWYQAIDFCNQLSGILGLEPAYRINKNREEFDNSSETDHSEWRIFQETEKNGFRLPTELEWEFAARGGIFGSDYEFSGSSQLDKVGWCRRNSHGESQPVGLLIPNELGLYDMSGNVWDWCADWSDTARNGVHGYKIFRGGGWLNDENLCFITSREKDHSDSGYINVGFRLARTAI